MHLWNLWMLYNQESHHLLLLLLSHFSWTEVCLTLYDPIDGSPPGSPVPGILQARILEWVAISFSNAWKWSRSVVSNSSRPHGSSIHGIFQARVLEWGAFAFSAITYYYSSKLTYYYYWFTGFLFYYTFIPSRPREICFLSSLS